MLFRSHGTACTWELHQRKGQGRGQLLPWMEAWGEQVQRGKGHGQPCGRPWREQLLPWMQAWGEQAQGGLSCSFWLPQERWQPWAQVCGTHLSQGKLQLWRCGEQCDPESCGNDQP